MKYSKYLYFLIIVTLLSCSKNKETTSNLTNKTAAEILGNPKYLAISYGGYRAKTRDVQPTITALKDDMKILSAMGIQLVRTYNVHFQQAENLLKAIQELKKEDSNFEMYVMLGAWIDCKNSFNWEGEGPNHEEENPRNSTEIKTAVTLANTYPDIVKIIAVGNEAMVKWATAYYVQPRVILKWVNHLQNLKTNGKLPKDLWITSSDDFASWGGGGKEYHNKDLEALIKAVDYVSMHTYPYHNSHYNPQYWKVPAAESNLSDIEKIDSAMLRALAFAKTQYKNVSNYVREIDSTKQIHIGETGWATVSNGFYGATGSRATDEYKQGLYYKHLREWTTKKNISCFYFEAFDEQWKDAKNPQGSENHFGLINLKGQAKYSIWELVDKGVFIGLKRDEQTITKTYNGNLEALMKHVLVPNIDYKR